MLVESNNRFSLELLVLVRGKLTEGILRTGLKLYAVTDTEERLVSVMTLSHEGKDLAASLTASETPMQLQLQIFFGALAETSSLKLRGMTAAEELDVLKGRQFLQTGESTPPKTEAAGGLSRLCPLILPEEFPDVIKERCSELVDRSGKKRDDGTTLFFDLADDEGNWLPQMLFDQIPTTDGAPSDSLDDLIPIGSAHTDAKRDAKNDFRDTDDIVCVMLEPASGAVWTYEHEGGFERAHDKLDELLGELS